MGRKVAVLLTSYSFMKYIDINHEQIPALGLGTYKLKGSTCQDAIVDAIEIGYRHIDTARMYENEQDIGQGIRNSGIDRDELFITTKIWYTDLVRTNVLNAANDSLRKLQTSYVNLLLIHWPSDEVPLKETLEALMEVQKQGKARLIGVSNFPPSLLKKAFELAPVVCNQVEYHPYLGQSALINMVREHHAMLTAYSPIAQGGVNEDATLQAIGKQYGKTPSQVALRWLVQQDNVAAIPRTSSHEHRVSNFDIFDFALTDDEMEKIHALSRRERLVNPHWAPVWDE